jgi:hypothetical protein
LPNKKDIKKELIHCSNLVSDDNVIDYYDSTGILVQNASIQMGRYLIVLGTSIDTIHEMFLLDNLGKKEKSKID